MSFAGGVFMIQNAAAPFNASHRVERLRFGPALPDQDVAANPLSGTAKFSANGTVCGIWDLCAVVVATVNRL